MAASAYLTYQDGRIEIPEDLQREWDLHNGARLQVLPGEVSASRIRAELGKDVRDIDWSVFEGCLSHLNLDLNAELEKERVRENKLDARP